MFGKPGSPTSENADIERRLLLQLLDCCLPDAIYFKDSRRRYIRLNEAECRVLGIATPQEVIGKTADRLVSSKRARAWRREESEVLVTGEPLIDRVEEAVQEDGSVRWLSATKVPVRNHDGAITGLFGITRDITDRRVDEHLTQQFVSTISHELRTPVTSIIGSLALVTRGAAGALPDPAARLLKIASANCQRLVHLINDILDLEKVETGMMVFDLKPVDVRALIEQEIAVIQSYADAYGVGVRLDPSSAQGKALADPERLAQVVSNLLSNAVKFSPRGEEVVVGCEVRQGMVRISVRDHGVGIPDDLKDRVFEKFVQVSGKASQKGGTGLGLSIVKQIVERLKGQVGFEPAPGGGTVFVVTLPSWDEGQEAALVGQRMTGSDRH